MNRLPQPFWIGLSVVALSIFFSRLSPRFLSGENIVNIMDQSSINIVVAVGMTLVIASAGIDLSAGGNVAVCGIVIASTIKAGFGVVPTVVVALLTGAILGLLNALLVVKLKINPFMATLAMMSVLGGGALIVTQGIPIYGFSPDFSWIGRGKVAGFPVSVLVCAVVVSAGVFLTRFTRLGIYVAALGGNEEALRRNGVSAHLYKSALYVLCGACAAIASVILTSKLNSAEPLAGAMVEMNAIATVVLGGTKIRGGFARIEGTLLAGILMGVIRNGLVLAGISSYYQQFVTGFIILAAIIVSERSKEEKGRKK